MKIHNSKIYPEKFKFELDNGQTIDAFLMISYELPDAIFKTIIDCPISRCVTAAEPSINRSQTEPVINKWLTIEHLKP